MVRVWVIAVVATVMGACGNTQSAMRSGVLLPTLAPASSTTPAEADPSPQAAADAAPEPSSPRTIDAVGDTAGATKVITVVSPSWSSPTANLILWERKGDGSWAEAGGPWEADVGGGGWAYEPGEAMRRSPIGSFGFGTGFGLEANPGYTGGWFVIGDTDYWVEDPASPDYNTHRQGPSDPARAPWARFEHLIDYSPAYRYAVLIGFNFPTRGPTGSGIFLHQSTGAPTAGCVSLPEGELLTTLRWIDPGSTRIVMGPESELAKL